MEIDRTSEGLREIEQRLSAVKAAQRLLNMEYGELYNERWSLQCELMRGNNQANQPRNQTDGSDLVVIGLDAQGEAG